MRPAFDRRLFLLGSLGVLARRPRSGPRQDPARTLVLIQLSGGNDGLSTLVPHACDEYARVRRVTRFGPAEVLRIDERVGLHPRLTELRALYERGRLALVEGIGYPRPIRSHFRSLDIWHAADMRGRGAGTGWIGRCIERLPRVPPHAVVHLGSRPPFALHSALRPPICFEPGLARLTDPARSRACQAAHGLGGSAPASDENLALVQTILSEARSSVELLHAALARSTNDVGYPGNPFAQRLCSAAALIHSGLGVRVCSLDLSGFDTHDAQRDRHDELMTELDAALGTFVADLEQSETGREALIVLFSEFGRRVAENASGGTDHGAAGLALCLGTHVRGGLHGRPPAMDALESGDLAFTTDFRALYANCVRHVFELAPADVLGADYPGLEVV